MGVVNERSIYNMCTHFCVTDITYGYLYNIHKSRGHIGTLKAALELVIFDLANIKFDPVL